MDSNEIDVPFEDIDSFYTDKYGASVLICPKGKFHPITFFSNSIVTINIPDFVEGGDWELKCYHHTQNYQYFLVFYLMNNNPRVFYQNLQEALRQNHAIHKYSDQDLQQ